MLNQDDEEYARRRAGVALGEIGLGHRTAEILNAFAMGGLVIVERQLFSDKPQPQQFRVKTKFVSGFFYSGSEESLREIVAWTKDRATIELLHDDTFDRPYLIVHTIGSYENLRVDVGRWLLISDEGYIAISETKMNNTYERIAEDE